MEKIEKSMNTQIKGEKPKEMRDLRYLKIKFDLDISDKQLALYFEGDSEDRSYMKWCFEDVFNTLHPDFWVKEVMFDEASRGLYAVDVLLFAELETDLPPISIPAIRKRVNELIADKDHAVMDVKVVIN